MRLIDANYIVEVAERAWDAWNLAMATQDTNRGVNKVIKRQELCKAVKAVADDAPAIDPETLPIVQQLRGALSKAVAEKEAAEALLAEYSGVDGCKTIKTCFGYPLDEVQRLVEADKAAKLQRAAKGDDSDESAQETARERLP
ncbi:hypothetical protein [Fournierella sp.]|uniref:hypothetical protein n=1 Tax=Allofournierella sp. TaxID=1940256 RepID=UPI0025C0744D|nr:hypothetical protein [Fournierella sp.]